MPSTTPLPNPQTSLPSAFEAANAGLTDCVEAMLERYCAEDELHARLLNTLSMLEHTGSRKIMATQSGRGLDHPTLRHLAEETRHASFFKRLAEKAARRELDYSPVTLAAPAAAQMYFQRLDGSTAKTLGADAHPKAAYLYMSIIVELRAVWFYRLYQAVLSRVPRTLSLRSILAEEEGHLEELSGKLRGIGAFDPAVMRHLCSVEQALFERLLGALERDIAARPLAA